MQVTKHAEKRLRERLGIPKKACSRHAQKALDEGLKHSELSGRAKRYFDGLFLRKHAASKLRVYGEFVFLFNTGDVLITVLDIPDSLRSNFRNIACKKEVL